MLDDDKSHFGWYYKLTEEDKEVVTGYFEEHNLEDLLGFCEALSIVASGRTWDVARDYLIEVGQDHFLRSCSTCKYERSCTPEYALYTCGARNLKWESKE